MLPIVDFSGLQVSRLILGANPFGGFSHQNPERDQAMLSYYSVDRILETWYLAEEAGINTMITNNESPNVVDAVKTYLSHGGRLQWIAQVNCLRNPDMLSAVDEVIKIGCKGIYFHGARVDDAYLRKDADQLREWCEYVRTAGIPVGVAGHAPEAHLWVDSLDLVDFHAVCFFNCGSLHVGKGDKFDLADIFQATRCIQQIKKPCIAYKIMGAGRIDPRMSFEYAFSHIKPQDVVNVGMYRGDCEHMVEVNAGMVREILAEDSVLGR
jgi:hypothetical protein